MAAVLAAGNHGDERDLIYIYISWSSSRST